jgi:hypothetical protein
MYVFNYHPGTGAFLGGSPADYDQLEPGRVLVPAWSSARPPPRHDMTTHWAFFVPAIEAWEIRPLDEVAI